MRTFILLSLLFGLVSCSDTQPKNSNTQSIETKNSEKKLLITAIDARFPLKLEEVNLTNKNTNLLNDQIVSKIEQVVKEYAKDMDFYDSSQTYRDTYINTIRLQDSLQTIYLVLLKHVSTEEINSRVLFYDNQKNEFADKEFEFKLYALYNFEKGKLVSTNLKTNFKISSPEIQLVDFNKDGVNDFKFTRLFHNGSFNSLHTTVLTITNSKIDTLSFSENAMGKWTEK